MAKGRKVLLQDAKNYQKQKVLVAGLHLKISNPKELNATLHEATTAIVGAGDDIERIEDLKVKSMMQNRHLAKDIGDANWGEIRRQLEYKVELTGGMVNVVKAAYTSQTCSCCGHCEPGNRDRGRDTTLFA